jgi:hypothetical protein
MRAPERQRYTLAQSVLMTAMFLPQRLPPSHPIMEVRVILLNAHEPLLPTGVVSQPSPKALGFAPKFWL